MAMCGSIKVSVDMGIVEPLIFAMGEVLQAKNNIDKVIALGTLRALIDVQLMADAARKTIGIKPEVVRIGFALKNTASSSRTSTPATP